MSDGISPSITSDSWGALMVGDTTYKDVKLWPGNAREWDWNETGTSHVPGVGVGDVEELVEGGARVVVLSTGRTGRLQVPSPTVDHLRSRGVAVEVLPTPDAIERYKALAADGVAVGALIHSTC